ncbi:MAG: YciI family protein [Acidimicrobiales bacterium]
MTAETAPRTAEPPSEFDAYELVMLLRPEARPKLDDETVDLLQAQHLGHLAAMKEAGHLKVAGPLTRQPDETWRGICVYQVGSIEEARRLAEADPAVRAGQLEVAVMGWFTEKGALSFH